MTNLIADPKIAHAEAQRELRELNALHVERALIDARLTAALERLEQSGVPTMRVDRHDGRVRDELPMPGSRVHLLREVWTNDKLDNISFHDAADCPFPWWCSNPVGELVMAERGKRDQPGIGFAYEGMWLLAGYFGKTALVVGENA